MYVQDGAWMHGPHFIWGFLMMRLRATREGGVCTCEQYRGLIARSVLVVQVVLAVQHFIILHCCHNTHCLSCWFACARECGGALTFNKLGVRQGQVAHLTHPPSLHPNNPDTHAHPRGPVPRRDNMCQQHSDFVCVWVGCGDRLKLHHVKINMKRRLQASITFRVVHTE
jgi:hypothetical protein